MADMMTLEDVRGQLSSWFGGSEACVDVKACDRLGEMINAVATAIKQREQDAKDAARLVDCINAQPPTRRSLIDRAERAEAELRRLAGERDELRTAYTSASQSRDYWKECAGRASSELAALKARIRGACLVPLTAVMLRDGYSLTVSGPMSVNDVDELAGKCVRLVVEE